MAEVGNGGGVELALGALDEEPVPVEDVEDGTDMSKVGRL